jgi:Fe-Mn family superoxide dismutase
MWSGDALRAGLTSEYVLTAGQRGRPVRRFSSKTRSDPLGRSAHDGPIHIYSANQVLLGRLRARASKASATSGERHPHRLEERKMNPSMDRRTAITAVLVAGAALTLEGNAMAQSATPAQAPTYSPRALPFDPRAVPGLSERMLTSHHQNNYGGAVRRLGAIQSQIATLDPATAPGFLLNGLKREELIALNSMILHEVYFAGLAGEARSPAARLGNQIERDFGSVDRWRAEFGALGKALGGGSGWVLLTWSPRSGRLINAWAADHTMTVADGEVLLALDMYEHAYAIDYGAAAGAYVDSFMAAMRWDAADRTFAAAARART